MSGTDWGVGIHKRLPKTGERFFEGGRRLQEERSRPLAPDKPVVSIITVVFNNEHTLQRCIDSVIETSYPNIEYIVIDGGSKDGTLDIIKENISNIDYAVSEPDKGIYQAMNKGISLCSGDYIALINSDDWLELDGVEHALKVIQDANAEIGIGWANVWSRENEFTHIWKIGNFDVRILLSGMSFCHQAVVASRHAYECAGAYDENIKISSDYKWVKALFRSGLTSTFIEHPIVNFSFDGVSANNRPIWKEECKQIALLENPHLDYDDVSAFLEFVYRDGPLDPNAITNIVNLSRERPELVQSMALVLLDKLLPYELAKKNVASQANKVPLKPQERRAIDHYDERSIEREIASFKPLPPGFKWMKAGRDFVAAPPKISVIIPVYNVEDWVEECAASVIIQDFDDIEIIFVNDGSPDNSQEILERLQASDPRVHIVKKDNGGLSSARNAGLIVASGEYVHFLDSDDYIRPGMYSRMYRYAKEHDLDLLKSNLGFIDDVYPTKKPILPKGKEVFDVQDCHFYLQFISPCAALYKRTLLEEIGGFEEGITYEDRPFNWISIIHSKRIGHVDEIFYMYRVDRPGSIMSSRQGNPRHFDALKALDVLTDYLKVENRLEEFDVEYVKEQLRVYSMLIDIHAIPKAMIGEFYLECRKRINAHPVATPRLYATNLPLRVRHLYRFLKDGEPDTPERSEGETYFFKALNYPNYPNKYRASSCELYLIACEKIRRRFPASSEDPIAPFKRACAMSTLFDYVHVQDDGHTAMDVTAMVDRLCDYMDGNETFNAFMREIHNVRGERKAYEHIGYLTSTSYNYLKCREMVESCLKSMGQTSYRTFEFSDIDFRSTSEAFERPYRKIMNSIKKLGLRSQAFSAQAAMAFNLSRKTDADTIKTLTVYFPHGAVERYLIEFLRDKGVRTIFKPHGLPQVAFHNEPFDYVLSITRGAEWRDAFPKSQIVHAGWSEQLGQSSTGRLPRASGKKKIQFLSQLTGEKVHRLEDFRTTTEFFIREALKLPADKFEIDIRLRNDEEKLIIGATYLEQAESAPNFSFSTISAGPMSESDADVLVSATSTALLYSQFLRVPAVQLATPRLRAHWPFDLVPDEFVFLMQQDKRNFADVLQQAAASKLQKMLYAENDMDRIKALLKHVFEC